MYKFILLVLVLSLVVACSKTDRPASASPNERHYPLIGKVVAVNKEKKSATIEHKDIPGYMEAMTMEFPIHADWVWNDLTPGSEIHAELVVDNNAKDPFWLENIGIVSAPNPNNPAPKPNENFAQIGQEVPDFKLTNQDYKPISMKNFRGKAVAITFIYAKCPLPDYCIKMSKNFSDLALMLEKDPEAKDKYRLLSISFDPANDTPAKLRSYGQGYLGNPEKPDFTVWQLAVGDDKQVRAIADFFGLRYEVAPDDKTQFVHSLRTAVIAPDGKVTKIFAGNEWTPADLLRELKTASQGETADNR